MLADSTFVPYAPCPLIYVRNPSPRMASHAEAPALSDQPQVSGTQCLNIAAAPFLKTKASPGAYVANCSGPGTLRSMSWRVGKVFKS